MTFGDSTIQVWLLLTKFDLNFIHTFNTLICVWYINSETSDCEYNTTSILYDMRFEEYDYIFQMILPNEILRKCVINIHNNSLSQHTALDRFSCLM